MDRNQLILAIAAALLAAFLLGWLVGAVLARLGRSSRTELDEIALAARQLIRAEAARDDALARLDRREAELGAELGASAEALHQARLEIEELRAYIDKRLRRD